MDFFKVKRFVKSRKSKPGDNPSEEDKQTNSNEPKNGVSDPMPESDPNVEEEEEDDDDDFITNEVKRRLKELRKNSFMVLIPEESCPEEEGDTSSSEWRESEEAAGDGYTWCSFGALYSKYCERMLFFDKMSSQQLKEAESWNVSNHSPKSTSKKLASALRSLSFKRREELQEDCEHLRQSPENDPYQNLETAYVAQVCLTWEALHCQYMHLSQKISSQPENPTSYCYAAQSFQQFQVLLQRFIENEPFEQGSRVEIYARARSLLPNLLQIPSFEALDQKHNREEDDMDQPILASDLMKVVEDSILTFRLFLKADRKKSGSGLNLFRGHNQALNSLQQVQASLDKKEIKLKELSKKKGWKKSWPSTPDEAELLLGLIDIKVVSRVLRMERISKEQLLWCEEKMSKLDLSGSKLLRDGCPILFPC